MMKRQKRHSVIGFGKKLMAVTVAFFMTVLVVGMSTPARADDPPATFVSTWDTEQVSAGSSAASQVALPLVSGGTYDFVVDWGDSTPPVAVTAWNDPDATHVYTTPGVKTVSITGTIVGFRFDNSGDRLKLTDVSAWGPLNLGNGGGYFSGASNFTISATDQPDLVGTTDMSNAFRNATSLTTGVSTWQVDGVTSMRSMFEGASALDADLSGWTVDNVTVMRSMFQGASAFNADISGWGVGSVNSMRSMFEDADAFDRNLGGWDVGSVADMNNMFAGGPNVGLSLDNYDSLLTGWATNPVQAAVDFDAGSSYYNPTVAATARGLLTDDSQWTITDLGPAGVPSTPAAPSAIAGSESATVTWTQPAANNSAITSYTVTSSPGAQTCTAAAPALTCVVTGLTNDLSYRFSVTATNAVGTSAASGLSSAVVPETSEPSAPLAPFAEALNESARIWVRPGIGGGVPVTYNVTASSGGGTCEVAVPATSCVISGLSNSTQYTFGATATNTFGTSPASPASNEITPGQPLSMTWDTTKTTDGSTAANRIRLPLVADGTYNFTVSWGDGTSNVITSGSSPDREHAYSTQGVKTITISGTVRGWNFSTSNTSCNANAAVDQNKLLRISNWGPLRLDSPSRDAFYFCSAQNLEISVPLTDAPNLANTTSLKGAFFGASKVSSDLDSWNVSAVTDMSSMFWGASAFNGALDSWDTGSVTKMDNMFRSASVFNQPLNSWNTALVQNMTLMFYAAPRFNQSLNSWNTSSVTNMSQMFQSATDFNGNVAAWDTSAVTNMNYMFQSTDNFNSDISGWNTGNVTTMLQMFNVAKKFNVNIGSWDTAKVTNMQSMFANTPDFNQDLSAWDTSAVTNMNGMFQTATAMNGDLDGWGAKTAAATNMGRMFYNATAFNKPLNSWNVGNVVSMREMFSGATSFNQPLNSWRPAKVTDMGLMFTNAPVFNGDISAWTVQKVANFESFAENASAFNKDIGAWNTTSVTTMAKMFKGATVFNQDLRAWDMGGVTTAAEMFSGAALSTNNYNKMLYSWAYGRSTDGVENGAGTGTVTDNVTFSAGSARYSVGDPTTARAILTGRGWSITDGGQTAQNVPNSPTNVQQTGTGTTRTISWDVPPTADPTVTSYRVRAFITIVDSMALTPTELGCTASGESASSCLVEGLTDGVSYLFDVVAINAIGASDPSQMQIPAVPAAPIAQSRFEAVKVGWIAQPTVGGDPTSYTITASGDAGNCTITMPNNTCEIIGLSNAQAYTFTATATNALGTSASSAASAAVTPGVAFVSTWRTQNAGTSATNQITLPLVNGGNYNFNVSWGDGTTDTISTFNSAAATHTYPTRGDYDVTITGTINGFRFANGGDKTKLVDIARWGPLQLGNLGSYFQGASQLQVSATDPIDLTGTTNLNSAFSGASRFNGAIGNWDVTNVTSMGNMFFGASAFNQPLNDWGSKTASVTDMSRIFFAATAFNQPINTWNVSNVTTFYQMFYAANQFNSSVSGWVPSSATNMQGMFGSTNSFNQPIDWTQTGSVTTMNSMFSSANVFNQSLASLNTSSVTDMTSMFQSTAQFDGDISTWNTGNVTTMQQMFYLAAKFNNASGLNSWNTANVTNMHQMFRSAPLFNKPIGAWNTGKVTNMSYMFQYSPGFNQPITTWDVSKVTTMQRMFEGATAFNQSLNGWNTVNVIGDGMALMFYGATAFNGAMGNWNVSKITDFSWFLRGASNFNQSLANWDTSQVTNFEYMFNGTKFRQDVTKWNVTKATNMSFMFWSITPESNVSGLRGTPWLNKTLIAWAAQPVRANVSLSFSDTGAGGFPKYTTGTYSLGSAAAYTFLTTATNAPSNPGKGWNVSTGGTTPVNTPGIPQNMTIDRSGAEDNGTTALITWSAPTNGDTVSPIDYRAQATNDSSVECTVLAAQEVTSCTVTGMVTNKFHQFTVTAINSTGDSDPTSPPLPVQNIGPLTPTLGTPTPTPTGFTVPITNYDGQYQWSGTATAGGTVAVSEITQTATVSNIAPDTTSVATITASRFAYTDQSSTATATSLKAALVPDLEDPVRTADGFTATINNYNAADYVWTATALPGPGTAEIVAIGGGHELQVTGLDPDTAATVTVSTTREGFAPGSTVIEESSLKVAKTPTFEAPVPTPDGFTAVITDYDDTYTWVATLPDGSPGAVGIVVPEGSPDHVVTVTGLDPGVAATVTVTASRDDSVQGIGEVSSESLLAERAPTFGTPTPTATGFTAVVTNFDAQWTWTGIATEGGAVTVTDGVATITNVAPDTATLAAITASRTGYAPGVTEIGATSLKAALVPVLGEPQRTPDGYNVVITNYDATDFTWAATSNRGSATILLVGTDYVATVTGLTPNDAATMTVSTTRTGYATGVREVTASSLNAKLTPAVDASVGTPDGFRAKITNYSADYDWSAAIVGEGPGEADIVLDGLDHFVVVTGLDAATAATATVTTIRDTYAPGTTSVSGTSLSAKLDPTFDQPVRTADGFTAVIDDYDPAFTWVATVPQGTAVVVADGEDFVVKVTGLAADTTVTATLTTTRTGYTPGASTVDGTSLLAALVPVVDPAVGTSDGFRAKITNHMLDYIWSAAIAGSGLGSAAIVEDGGEYFVVVTGLDPAIQTTATVTTTKTDYASGSTPVTGTSLGAVLVPLFDEPVRTADGFTSVINNYSSSFTWAATAPEGAATVVADGGDFVVQVTGLGADTPVTATVTTTRDGFANGQGTVTGTSLLAAYVPTFDGSVSTSDGFRAKIANYDAAFGWSAAMADGAAGTAAVVEESSEFYVVVTGVAPATATSATVITTQTDYATGSAPATGTALGASQLPIFDEPVRTSDGFTAVITNYNGAFTWEATVPDGAAAVISNGPNYIVSVTGFAADATVTATVTTTRTNFTPGEGTVEGTSLLAAYVPALDGAVSTPDGFTSKITNYIGGYDWSATIDTPIPPGASASITTAGDDYFVTVAGLAPLASVTVTAQATNAESVPGTSAVTGSALDGPYNPVVDPAEGLPTGFRAKITNYNADYDWVATIAGSGPGSADVILDSGDYYVVVTALPAATEATATVTTTRTGFTSGSTPVTGASLGAALNPTFATPVRTADGFTAVINDYNDAFDWDASAVPGGSAVVMPDGENFVVSVTGLSANATATATVTTTQAGFADGEGTIEGTSLLAARVPEFDEPVSTPTGFRTKIANYDVGFIWSAAMADGSPGSVTIAAESAEFYVVVTGLDPAISATATVSTTQTDYATGSAGAAGTSLAAAYVPILGPDVTRTPSGFTAVIDNYDAAYTWDASASPGDAAITNAEGIFSVTVTGLASGGVRSTATVTAASDTSVTGSAEINGRSTLALLTPEFASTVRGVNQFTAQITNYDPDYEWAVTATPGQAAIVETTVGGDTQQILTVTGLTDGEAAVATVTATVAGTSIIGSNDVSSSALDAALNPTFGTPVPTDGGFRVPITNYDGSYDWSAVVDGGQPGSAAVSEIESQWYVVVSGLGVGESSSVTVTTTRNGYRGGTNTASGISLRAALTPAFGPVVPQDRGFTIPITNYDATYDWTQTAGTIDSNGVLVVTGLTDGETVDITVTTAKAGYFGGTNDTQGTSLYAELAPNLAPAVPSDGGFTVEILNYDGTFDWTLTPTVGSAVIDTDGLIVVTGLGVGVESTVTVDTAKTDYLPGTSSALGKSLMAAFNPQFGAVTATVDGFTTPVTNYVAGFGYQWTPTAGSAALVVDGPTAELVVTGLGVGDRATMSVVTTQAGYFDGSGAVSGRAILGGLVPEFGTPDRQVHGFTAAITNYDPDYSWDVVTLPGQAAIVTTVVGEVTTAVVTVTGLTDGQVATATVTTATPEQVEESNDVSSSALDAALNPAFGTPVPTDGGFRVPITDYDGSYDWSAVVDGGQLGSAAVSEIESQWYVVVSGLGVGDSSSVTVTTTRNGYRGGTNTASGISLRAALTPAFGPVVPQDRGFTIPITNYDATYDWTQTAGTIDSNGALVVTDLTDGQTVNVTVTTSQDGFFDGTNNTSGTSLRTAYDVQLGGAVEGSRSFTVPISNYDADFVWGADAAVGTATVENLNDQWVAVVGGLDPLQQATVTVTASRAGYKDGSASETGSAAIGGQLNPTLGTAVPTADGFTAEITDYDAAFTWVADSTLGQAAVVGQGVVYSLVVTGVDPNTAVSATVTTTRTSYDLGSATTSATSLKAALPPVLVNGSRLNQAFSVEIENYTSQYNWSATSTFGNATVSDQGLVRVTGLAPGQVAELNVMSNKTAHAQGIVSIPAEAISASLVPQFSPVSPTANGFTTQVTNYDGSFSWAVVGAPGQASINGSGLVTVSGLGSGVGSTVSVTTTRSGYQAGTASVAGQAAVFIPPATPPTKPTITKVKVKKGKVKIGYFSQSTAPITSAQAVCKAGGSKLTANGRGSTLTVKQLKRGKKYKCWVQASNVFGKSPKSEKVKFKAK